MNTETSTERVAPGAPESWQWYHFYFLLAFFNLSVIIASLVLYHQTVTSYELALRRLDRIHTKHRWIVSLRVAAAQVNAPGNDVFASRDVDKERARFERSRTRLTLLLRRERELGVDLSEFRDHLDSMINMGNSVFESFEKATARGGPIGGEALAQAAEMMAAMDREQAMAVTALSEQEQLRLMRAHSLLNEYGAQLATYAAFEKLFFALVALILATAFLYGRKLHRLTERMIMDQQAAMRERHERLAAVGEVCSAVAHGIRNPLAAISSSAQLALDYGTLDDATRLRTKDILTECRRLDHRITQLLNFSSAQTDHAEDYDLASALEQAIDEITLRFADRRINLTRRIDAGRFMLRGDRERMVQCFIEILSNSIDHTAVGGHISVTCMRIRKGPYTVAVDFIDDGPGIPDRLAAKVFDLFFTTKERGVGIGLASVKRGIEFHGGDVSVVPGSGKGAHIRIRLPTV